MIHESSPWKDALRSDAAVIERWASKKRSTERRSFLLERKVFLAAYAIRKLHETSKISTALAAREIKVVRYSPIKPSDARPLSNFNVEKYFDVTESSDHAITMRSLLNVLIHSRVFLEKVADDEEVIGFVVTSDREKSKGLYEVELAEFVSLMRAVAEDFPTSAVQTFDEKAGIWRTWVGHADPDLSHEELLDLARAGQAKNGG